MLDKLATVGLRLRGQARQAARDRRGVTAVEYGVVAALVIVVCIGAIHSLGQSVFTELYSRIAVSTAPANAR